MFYGVTEEDQKEIDQLISKRLKILNLNAKRSFWLRSIKELKEISNSSKDIDEAKKKLSKVEHEISLLTSTKTIIEFDRESQNRFNQILRESEEKRFALFDTPYNIIDDAKEMANDALVFLYAEASQHIPGEIKESEFVEIERTLSPRSELNYLTWNFAKSLKECYEKPLFKLPKEGAADFIIYNAIPKHFEALRKLDSDVNLHDIINECLEQSDFVFNENDSSQNTPAPVPKTCISYKKREFILDPNYDVAMKNVLIENCINSLNTIELKLLRLAITQCREEDTELYEYAITAQKFTDYFGLNNKYFYSHAKEMMRNITAAYIELENGTQNWVDRCLYKDGVIYIKLAEGLKPYITQLKACYSKIKISEYTALKSKHAIIIRELIQAKMAGVKPYANVATQISISIEELQRVTNTTSKYTKISSFRKYVLDQAIKEINDYEYGYHITITPYRNGKKIDGFYFTIESQQGYNHRIGNSEHADQIPQKVRTKKTSKRNPKEYGEQLTLDI